MVTRADVKIVSATREQIPFVAWVVNTASRSHLPRGMWDLLLADDEPEVLRYLEVFADTEQLHWGHWSLYMVAEVDGVAASGMCGFFENELPAATMMAGAIEANRKSDRSPEEQAAGWERAKSIVALSALRHEPGAWVVEHVATRPEFRRQGLLKPLMQAILERGRERGATVADIGVLIGNDPAQRAYEKLGFRVVEEVRDAEFEAAYGSAGARMMRRAL